MSKTFFILFLITTIAVSVLCYFSIDINNEVTENENRLTVESTIKLENDIIKQQRDLICSQKNINSELIIMDKRINKLKYLIKCSTNP